MKFYKQILQFRNQIILSNLNFNFFKIKRIHFIYLFLISASVAHAQVFEKGIIKGSLLDEQNQPILFANVLLKNTVDSILYKGELSNDQGMFYFDLVKEGTYFLEIEAVGFEKTTKLNIELNTANPKINLEALQLKAISHQLEAVTVIAYKPLIERQADKTIVNIANSIIQSGSSVMEMMEKLPGVKVDQDGSINLKGKQGVIVAINGKPTILSGQDLANLLKGMSSSNIQKVEISTNPSSKYDASGNAGLINIVMKKNKKEGINGNVSLGYGQGRYAKYYAGFSLNAKNTWYNLYFNYTCSNRKGFLEINSVRDYSSPDTLKSVFESNNYNTRVYNTHMPTLGADFYLSKKTTLTLSGGGLINTFKTSGNGLSSVLDSNRIKTNGYNLITDSKDNWFNYSASARLLHQFDSTGKEISFDLDYAEYWNNTDQVYTTQLLNAKNTFVSQSILIGDQNGKLNIYAAKADYTLPLKNDMSLDAGIKSSYVYTDNNSEFYNEISEELMIDSSMSSHFVYSENINAAYINVNKKYKKLTVQPGLRLEQTNANGEQLLTGQKIKSNYIQLFPSISLDYKINDKHGLNLNIGKRIDRPAYQRMNPFRVIIDAATYAEGNPYLKPAITYNSELTHSFKDMFFTTVGYSLTTDYITDVLLQDAEKQTTVLTVINLDRLHWYHLDFLFSKKICKWWTTNINFTSYYGRYVGKINDYNVDRGAPSFQFSTNNSFSILDGLSMESNFSYSHSSQEDITLIKPNYNFSIGIQKMFFNKKASLTVNISDLFWTSYFRGTTQLGTVHETWTNRGEERIVRVNFIYRFGKNQERQIHQNSAGDAEKSRTSK